MKWVACFFLFQICSVFCVLRSVFEGFEEFEEFEEFEGFKGFEKFEGLKSLKSSCKGDFCYIPFRSYLHLLYRKTDIKRI